MLTGCVDGVLMGCVNLGNQHCERLVGSENQPPFVLTLVAQSNVE